MDKRPLTASILNTAHGWYLPQIHKYPHLPIDETEHVGKNLWFYILKDNEDIKEKGPKKNLREPKSGYYNISNHQILLQLYKEILQAKIIEKKYQKKKKIKSPT